MTTTFWSLLLRCELLLQKDLGMAGSFVSKQRMVSDLQSRMWNEEKTRGQ